MLALQIYSNMENFRIVRLASAILLVTVASALEFPSTIPKCVAGDNECIARSIQYILRNHIHGIPEIGLSSLDPLPFSNADISTGQGQGAVSVNLTIDSGVTKGWKDMQVKRVTGFNKDPRQNKIELHVFVPKDIIFGKYSISGKILLLPIAGNGDLTFVYDDLQMVVKVKTKVETRNGEEYLKIKSVFCDIDVKKWFINFTNLFNDRALSDNMNLVLNQNEKLLYSEVKHSFGVSRGKLLKDYFNRFFEKFPYRMLFAD